MLSLRDLQLRFAAALSANLAEAGVVADRSRGAAAVPIDPALLELVRGRGALGAPERLEIYRDMYRSRLVDVLRGDFPRVVTILGDDEFRVLACRYLACHPSTHPSVRYVGRRFAEFVAGETAVPPFLGDLARLEWARVDVFDARDAEPLGLSDLESIPPSAWAALRFRPIPACLVVECAWPAHEIWAAADTPGPGRSWAPGAAAIRVWREGSDVSHAAMGDIERRAFPMLQRGEPFARLCAALEDDLDPEAAAAQVGSLLMRWLEDGLLARFPS